MLIFFKNIYFYRELISNLVVRELQTRYRRTIFGFLWSFLNPIFLMMVYTLVFSYFVRVEMENYSSFVFCGLLTWIWFSSSLSEGVNSIINGASLITKTFFPIEVLPVVSVLHNCINYLFSLPVLIVFLLFNKISLGAPLFFLIILLLFQLLFTLGIVFIFASLNVFYRDVQHIILNLITFWFFLCPIVYPVSYIPDKYKVLIYLNPMALFSISYQDIFYFNRAPELLSISILFAVSFLTFYIGLLVFNRYKSVYAEEL